MSEKHLNSFLHIGQLAILISQLSMHSEWKMWKQLNIRQELELSKEEQQTTQLDTKYFRSLNLINVCFMSL